MTTVGMPGHGFTFPVEGIVPVIFSSMVLYVYGHANIQRTYFLKYLN
jgi:hypothetical protein